MKMTASPKNHIIADVITKIDNSEKGYEARTYTRRFLKKNNIEWKKLLERYSGKRVKITFEEYTE